MWQACLQKIKYMFGDDSDVLRLISSFTDKDSFEYNTTPYKTSIQKKTGGIFGMGQTVCEITCPLDESIFNILSRMHKSDFYKTIIDYIRDNSMVIKRTIDFLNRANVMDISVTNLNEFINNFYESLALLFKKFIYVYILNCDEESIKALFETYKISIDYAMHEIVGALRDLRDQTSESLNDTSADKNSSENGVLSSNIVASVSSEDLIKFKRNEISKRKKSYRADFTDDNLKKIKKNNNLIKKKKIDNR